MYRAYLSLSNLTWVSGLSSNGINFLCIGENIMDIIEEKTIVAGVHYGTETVVT